MSLPFELRDPKAAPTYEDGAISRLCRKVRFEARDEVFLRLTGGGDQ